MWILEEAAARESSTLPAKPSESLVYQLHAITESDG
jgi:hypothetical protein